MTMARGKVAAHTQSVLAGESPEGAIELVSGLQRTVLAGIWLLAAAVALVAIPAAASAAVPGYFAVDFISDNAGWVAGSDATVLATVNGGKAWQTPATTPGGAPLLDICVLPDGRTGWAVGAAGTVLRTTDGKSWTRVFSSAFNASYSYTSVRFVDARTGWIAGGVAAGPFQGTPAGAILRTTDGGLTWSPAAASSGWCPVALDAVSASSAVCAGVLRVNGSNAPAVVRTNNGSTWSAPALLRPAAGATSEVGGLAMSATKAGANVVAVGDYCELLPPTPFAFSSTTAGTAFAYLAGPRTGPTQLRGVSLTSATAGFAVGTGANAVLQTTTGGASWTALSSPLAKNLQAVDFTSATTGYAVGRTAAGTAPVILKTTTGAASWTAVK